MDIREKILTAKQYVKVYNKPKIFCVGANKTGTTSLKTAMADLGFVVGYQTKAEKLIPVWARRKFDPIIKYCYSAQFFQDIPFSLPYSYIALDQAFPNSKFILTVRDDTEQWYNSITRSHAKIWGKNGRIPTAQDLKEANYHYEGGVWNSFNLIFQTLPTDPYNREKFFEFYEQHNREVITYFRHRQDDLLILNVAEIGAYKKLCDFLGVVGKKSDFPWENKT